VNIDQNISFNVIDEAISCLETVREGIALFRANPRNTPALQAATRDAQSIKGAASMIDQTDIYELAKRLETELRKCPGGEISEDMERQFAAQLDELEILLLKKKASLARAESMAAEAILPPPKTAIALNGNFFRAEEDFEADPETLEIFSLEADDLLRNIADQLKILARTPGSYDALMEVRRSAHTLKGSAAIIGMKPLSSLAHRMEDLLDFLTEHRLELSAEVHLLLSASADCLAALAHGETREELQSVIADVYLRYNVTMTLLEEGKTSPVSEAEPAELAVLAEENKDESEILTGEEKHHRNSIIRISIERLDELMRLFSEVLQSRATIEQRLADMEKQVQELQHSTGRLRQASGKLEIDFEAGMMKTGALRGIPSASAPAFNTSGKAQEFDELEFDRYTEFHQVTRQLVETGSDVASINIEMESLLTNLESVFGGQRHLIDEIQKRLMQFRMVAFDSLGRRLLRTVRITAEQEDKFVDLAIEGGELEVDTQILDSLIEPLLHILRNAVSHGIEAPDTRKLLGKPEHGVITLRLSQEGTFVVLSVSDDGRGVQLSDLRDKALKNHFVTESQLAAMTEEEILSLVFLPGLSTSTEVSEVSGRGVGMNIVKESLSRYQGTVSVSSELQKGTTFTLRVPMALSAMRALLVKAGSETYAIPLNLVKQVIEISVPELEKAKAENLLSINNHGYQLTYLNGLLSFPELQRKENSSVSVLLLKTSEDGRALVVDELLPPQEIVLKPLCFPLQNSPGFLGASILGNGKVVPVLDLVHLLKQTKRISAPVSKPKMKANASVMIVDDSPSVRRIMSAVISSAGWEVKAAKDGLEAFEMLRNDAELPKVILTDVEMPRMDGYELLATLKRHDTFKQIPVIIITSRAGDKHRRKALDLGVSEYVTKPYEDSVLTEIIKRLASS
jgi:chemosensory pili system protein ChpA (sensor histidine kinase/response regulator)